MIKNSFPLTPLSRLRHGHDEGAPAGVCNVRISGREEGLDELAASIASVGLLQPLVVVRHEGLSYVADGNRRLAALLRLAAAGTIPEDQEIDVVERDASTAREAGLAANLTQATMHEADQMVGFAQLAAGGLKPKEIASRFGVSVPHVKKLLALGSVAPCILDAWRTRKHGVNLDAVKAFTLAPSVAEQERVYGKLTKAGGSIYCHQIREELGIDRSIDRLLKAVGLQAFKAAGGHVIEDLFGESTAVSDRALLKRLADEKLIARRDELRGEGWGWVEIEGDLPPHARFMWSTIGDEKLEPSETQAARLREIEAVLDADDGSLSDEAAKVLADEHRAIEEDLLIKPGNGDRPRSGCIVALSYDGGIDVREYVLRPEEKATAPAAALSSDAAPAEPEAKGLSSALLDRLSVQLTEAVQDAFASSGHVAIAALLAGVTCGSPWQSPFRMRSEGNSIQGQPLGNEHFETLFARFVAMPLPDLLTAAGRILARGIDLRTRTPGAGTGAGAPIDSKAIQALAGALDAETLAARLRDRFDAKDFFSSAPKAVTLAAIEEACGAEAAARAGKLKKGELVEVAVATVVPSGWLPREIRWPGYAGPGAEQGEPEAMAA